MATTIGGVNIRIGASVKALEYDLKKAENALKKTADRFRSIGTSLSIGITAPVIAAGAGAFKMASDFDESLNKVRVAFGDSAADVERFASTTLKGFGIASGSALDMAATFGDMGTSMGLTTGEAAKMSTSLVGLAGDLASFKNINIGEATTALSGVFTGETESLKRLGIVMLETNLQAFALTKGITKQYKEMSQAEKVNLRFQYILNATKNSQGDFSRTSGGAANQMRIFQESLKEVGSTFGRVLLPVITPIIKRINDMVQKFGELDESTKKTILIFAGIAAAVGPLLIIIGQVIGSYGLLIGAMKSVIATSPALIKVFTFSFGPYIAGIAAVGVAIYGLVKGWREFGDTVDVAKVKQEAIRSITEQTNRSLGGQYERIDRLTKIAKAENVEKSERIKALNALIAIDPRYQATLEGDRILTDKLTRATADLKTELFNAAIAKGAQQRIEELAGELVNLESGVKQVGTAWYEDVFISAKNFGNIAGTASDTAVEGFNNQRNAIKKTRAEMDALYAFIDKTKKTTEPTTTPRIATDPNAIKAAQKLSEKIKDIFADTERDVKNIDITPDITLESVSDIDKIQAKIEAYRTGIRKLLDSGVTPDDVAISNFRAKIQELLNLLPKEAPTFNIKAGLTFTDDLKFSEIAKDLELGLITPLEAVTQRIEILKQRMSETGDEMGVLATQLKGLEEQKITLTVTSNIDDAINDIKKSIEAEQFKVEVGWQTAQAGDVNIQGIIDSARKQLAQFGGLGKEAIDGLVKELNIPPQRIPNPLEGIAVEWQNKLEDIKEFAAPAIEAVSGFFGQMFANQQQAMDDYYNGEKQRIEQSTLSQYGKAEAMKRLDDEMLKRRKQQARKEAIIQKALAVFNAAITGAQAVIAALSKGGPIYASVIAGLIAAQVALIASAPLPSLAIGTDRVKSDGIAYLHKGEAVVPADVVNGGFTGAGRPVEAVIRGSDLHILSNYQVYLDKRLR